MTKIEKSKNLKLVTELILFNSLYLDFKNKDFDDLIRDFIRRYGVGRLQYWLRG